MSKRITTYYILTLLLTSIVCSSCDDTIKGMSDKPSKREIGVSPYVQTLATAGRAAAIEGNADFQVTGSEFGLCVNADDNGTYNIANTSVEYDGSAWQIAGDKLYWPTSETAVDFYAWRPKEIVMLSNESYSSFNDFLMFKYDTKAGATPNDNNITLYKNGNEIIHKTDADELGLQEDVMFALTLDRKNPTQQSAAGEVPDYSVALQFKHTLTRLKFQYNTEVETTTEPKTRIEVMVKAITLHNVRSKATCSIFSATNIQWHDFTDALPNYHCVPMPWSNNQFKYGETPNVITSTNDLMIIPQEVNKWDTGNSIAANDAMGTPQAYLRIYCDLQQVITRNGVETIIPLSGNYTAIDAAATEVTTEAMYCVYVPIDDKNADGDPLWKAGNQVTYTLTFGGGYDNEGNLGLYPINVIPTLTNWITDSGSDDI